jgi:hypothetical protein
VAKNLFFQQVSKNFMLKKDSKMNPGAVRPAVKPVNRRVAEELAMPGNRGKCTRQFVQAVGSKLRYLSNRLVINRYIAVIVIRQPAVTRTGKYKDRRILPAVFLLKRTDILINNQD